VIGYETYCATASVAEPPGPVGGVCMYSFQSRGAREKRPGVGNDADTPIAISLLFVGHGVMLDLRSHVHRGIGEEGAPSVAKPAIMFGHRST